MGLLTIKAPLWNKVRLGFPNYSIRTLYWEYLIMMTNQTSPDMTINASRLDKAIVGLAVDGDVERFVAYVSENAFSKLSDHDLQHFDEKYIQIMLLSYLFMSRIYVPMSEYETVPGRADIYLQRSPLLPQVKYEWVFELKYCKAGAKETEIAAKCDEGLAQLRKYLASDRLKGHTDLKAAVIVFIGKNKYKITEIS
jgi:hypothetical protein